MTFFVAWPAAKAAALDCSDRIEFATHIIASLLSLAR
jgi:hypothetical protein